jgi:glutathione S-transferase
VSSERIKLVSFKLCPFVQRAVIALEEKGVDYELEYIDLESPPDWFKQRSPLGKVPLMLVNGRVLFESAVILDYLDEVYPPRLHPQDPFLRAQHKAWIEYGSGLLMKQHGLGLAHDEESYRVHLRELRGLLDGLIIPLDEGLFGGENAYSLVDVAFTPLFTRWEILVAIRPGLKASMPFQVADWSSDLLARPCVTRSVVEDFATRYLDFLRQKGSWLLAGS